MGQGKRAQARAGHCGQDRNGARRKPVEVSGHRLVNLMLTEVLARNTDGQGSYLGTMRYRAVTEPVS